MSSAACSTAWPRPASNRSAAYLALLDRDAAEAEQIVNRFTVKETYFYREAHQFRCLVADLLPARIAGKHPGERVRIWSLPCATGEEPYSIALWLLENWALVDAYNVEILGSDIDTARTRRRPGTGVSARGRSPACRRRCARIISSRRRAPGTGG